MKVLVYILLLVLEHGSALSLLHPGIHHESWNMVHPCTGCSKDALCARAQYNLDATTLTHDASFSLLHPSMHCTLEHLAFLGAVGMHCVPEHCATWMILPCYTMHNFSYCIQACTVPWNMVYPYCNFGKEGQLQPASSIICLGYIYSGQIL